jgi:hypothetical protein
MLDVPWFYVRCSCRLCPELTVEEMKVNERSYGNAAAEILER